MAKVRVQELDVEDYDLNVDSYDEELYRKIPGNEKNCSYRNDKQDKKNTKNYRNSKRSLKKESQESFFNK